MPWAATKSKQTWSRAAQRYRNMKSGSGMAWPLERTATMRNAKQTEPGTVRLMRTLAVNACWLELNSAEKVPFGVNGSSSSTCSFMCPLNVCLGGGVNGITPVPNSPWMCRSVEMRDACTAARLPPAPLVTGAKAASSAKCCTACLRMRPPLLLMSMDTITGVQPSLSTLAVWRLPEATLAQQGASRQKKAFAIHCSHRQVV
mmetsp:Transcript_38121/g.118927  ORF Transcript_38121/g.118927 Transcript_38121/m.118927 type:complete len:202 (+) Transcript_38121:521-1126(+)